MTPRYVARSYNVDPRELAQALGLEQGTGERPTLESLAQARGMSFDAYARRVKQALDGLRATPDE